jgi:hypothetical protein
LKQKQIQTMLHALGKEGYHLTSAPGKQDAQAIDQQTHARQEHHATDIHLAVGSQSTPSTQDEREPKKRWYCRIPWWKILEGLGIIGVIWYAAVSHIQWRDLRHNFEIDQRSWVMAEISMGITDPLPSVMLKATNVGKSPALKLLTVSMFEIVDRDKGPDLPPVTHDHLATRQQIQLLFPNKSVDTPVQFLRTAPNTGTPQFNTSELADLRSGRSYLAVFGTAFYEDQFGKHWTRFCVWKDYAVGPSSLEQPTFAARSCVAYNSVGDGTPRD